MATIYAVQSGDWSDTATWNGGVVPTGGDDVYSNGYYVVVDESIIVDVLSNAENSGAGITAGGGFTVADDVSMTFVQLEPDDSGYLIIVIEDCELSLLGPITSGSLSGCAVYLPGSAADDVIINANSIAGEGDDATYAVQVGHGGTLVLNVVGDILGSTTGGTGAVGVFDTEEFTLNVGGDVIGGESRSAVMVAQGLVNIDVTGDVKGGSGSDVDGNGITVYGDASTISIGGNVVGGDYESCSGLAVYDGPSTISVGGDVRGGDGESSMGIGIYGGTTDVTVLGSISGGSDSGSSTSYGLANYDGDLLVSTGSVSGGAKSAGVYTVDSDLELTANVISGGSGEDSIGVLSLTDGDVEVTAGLVTAGSGDVGIRANPNAGVRTVEVASITSGYDIHAIDLIGPYTNDDQVIVYGQLTSSPNGFFPIQAGIIKIKSGEETDWTMARSSGGTTILSNSGGGGVGGLPAESDVRAGVSFGSVSVGTLQVPNPRQVAFGVPVDHTVGEVAILLPQVVNYFGEQIRAAFNLESGIVFIEATVYHGANANKERPNNPGPVIWVGSVEPLNALNGDAWIKE